MVAEKRDKRSQVIRKDRGGRAQNPLREKEIGKIPTKEIGSETRRERNKKGSGIQGGLERSPEIREDCDG
jgi:hypothetical protein